MEYFDLCKKGYEHMASVQTIDDACEAAEFYMEGNYYISCEIVRYKRSPGCEDAYAVMLLPRNFYI